MTPDPLTELIGTALELLNRAFVVPGDGRSLACEFYHQFRKLWDRGIPVGMGLGHTLLKPIGDGFVIERIAEKGQPAAVLAVIAFGDDPFPNTEGRRVRIIRDSADRYHTQPG